ATDVFTALVVYGLMTREFSLKWAVGRRTVGHDPGPAADVRADRPFQGVACHVGDAERPHLTTSLHEGKHRGLGRRWLALSQMAILRLTAHERLVGFHNAFEQRPEWVNPHSFPDAMRHEPR